MKTHHNNRKHMREGGQESADIGKMIEDSMQELGIKKEASQPLQEGDIRPPTLEERIRSRQQKEAAGQEEKKGQDEEAGLPEIEVVELLPGEEKDAAKEAAAVVEERRQTVLENRLKGLMQELEKFDQLQGQGVKAEVADKIRSQLEASKKELLMDLWSDSVSRSDPETQVFITRIGEKNAKPGDMDTFRIGVGELAKNFQAVTGKMNVASSLLDRLKSDRKYIHAGVPQTEEQWDKRVRDTRDRIQKDFQTFVDQQKKLRERLSRQKGGRQGETRDQAAAA